jgi:Sulfotransferase family
MASFDETDLTICRGPGDTMFDYDSMHASISMLRQKQIFFVGGSPKSGTTWLQLLLDAHPSVSCSGEGYFPTHLWRFLSQALGQHDRVIETNNKLLFTELEEYQRLTQDDVWYIFASCIAVFLAKQSKHKPARAIGDKTPGNSRAFAGLAALFPTAKFIQIVRDGRDCAVSGWFHNLRNPDWVPLNRGSLEAYVTAFAEFWVSELAKAQEFANAHPDRIRRIRYEDLAGDTDGILAGLFEFLGVEVDASVLAHCRTEASFVKRSGGRNPGEENRQSFFRKGMVGDWRNHLSEEQNKLFRERAGGWLDRLGYA